MSESKPSPSPRRRVPPRQPAGRPPWPAGPRGHSFLDLCGRPKGKGGLGLNPSQALTLIQLVSFKRDERMPFPSVGLLGSRMGISPQSVRKNLADLARRGLITKRLRRGRSTMFDLTPLFRRLEVLQHDAKVKKDAATAAAKALLLPKSHPAPGGAEV
ncbi:MAG: helix-turn-helix domain-containing protein [Singulisphaera sp.]